MKQMRGVSWALVVLLAAGVLGCSSDSGGPDSVTPVECQTNEECPSGNCQEGVCVSFTGQDLEPEDVGGGSKDVVVFVDAAVEQDEGTPAEDIAAPPQDVPPVKPPVGAPDITVDPLDHKFTYIPGGNNPQTKAVAIYNEGLGQLVINKIEWKEGSSPEFTFMALPPTPAQLAPWGQTAVTVVFKEKAPHGPGTLLITSNDPDEPVVEVVFTSESKVGDQPCIGLSPQVLNFGSVVRGDKKTMPFDVINCSSNLVLQISKIERSKFFGMPLTDEIYFEPSEPVTPMVVGANQAITLNLTYAPGLAGVDNGYFTFHNNDPTMPQAKLDVKGVGIPPPLEEIGLHIEMEWDVDNSDVDMHLLAPGGKFWDCDTDCYFGNMSPDWGVPNDALDDPFLDYDDVDGYGPENTNLSEPQPGKYKLIMHYYNDSYDAWDGGPTNVTVRIYSYAQLLKTFQRKLNNTDHTWDVCFIDWPGAAITELGSMYQNTESGWCLPDWGW